MSGRCDLYLGLFHFVAESIQNLDSGGAFYEHFYASSGYEHKSEKKLQSLPCVYFNLIRQLEQ